MATIIELVDYIILLRQKIQQQENMINELSKEIEKINNNNKK